MSVTSIKKKATAAAEKKIERRVDFPKWRDTVEGRFDAQDDILKDQASTLKNIDQKLDVHIQTTADWKREQMEITNNWKEELRPVIATHQSMQQGVEVIGKVGSVFGWIGRKIATISVVIAAVLGALAAYHQWIH